MNVLVKQAMGTRLLTRTTVSNFMAALPGKLALTLDFMDVQFVSRSAAHQLLLEKEQLEKSDSIVSLINMSEELQKVFDIVSRTLYASAPLAYHIPVIKVENEEEMLSALQVLG